MKRATRQRTGTSYAPRYQSSTTTPYYPSKSEEKKRSSKAQGSRAGGGDGEGVDATTSVNQASALRAGRCGVCEPCRRPDCGQCENCLGKVKFGGDGRSKQSCIYRKCKVLHAPSRKHLRSGLNDFDDNLPPMPPPVPPVNGNSNSNNHSHHDHSRRQKGSLSVHASLKHPPGSHGATQRPIAINGSMSDAHEMKPSSYIDYILFNGKEPADYLLEHRSKKYKQESKQQDPNQFSPALSRRSGKSSTNNPKPENHEAQYEEHQQQRHGPRLLHGLPIPDAPPRNRCAECRRSPPPELLGLEQGGGAQSDQINVPVSNKGAAITTLPSLSSASYNAFIGDQSMDIDDDVILLCDGLDCGREYHLKCIPLSKVPAGETWYCVDCSRKGTAAYDLLDYLRKCDETRGKYASSQLYRATQRREDIRKVQQIIMEQKQQQPYKQHPSHNGNAGDAGNSRRRRGRPGKSALSSSLPVVVGSSTAMAVKGPVMQPLPNIKYPTSELNRERLEQLHCAALADPNLPLTSLPIAPVLPGSKQVGMGISTTPPPADVMIGPMSPSASRSPIAATAITACCSEKYSALSDCATSSVSVGPDFLIGKPIRLYEPNSEQYHTGRIVDFRLQQNQKQSNLVTEASSLDVDNTQYLVRFPAGTEGRKRRVIYHWMFLEEHDLSVGTTLVKASVLNVWQPCILWLRTARSILFQEPPQPQDEADRLLAGSAACHSGASATMLSTTISRRRLQVEFGDYQRPLYQPPQSSPRHPQPNRNGTITNGSGVGMVVGSRRAGRSRGEKLMAWVKSLDPSSDYAKIDAQAQSVALIVPSNNNSISPFANSDSSVGLNDAYTSKSSNLNDKRRIQILNLAAMTEWREQQKVRHWCLMLKNKQGDEDHISREDTTPNRFSVKMRPSHDEFSLEPVILSNPKNPASETAISLSSASDNKIKHADLCPLIPQGLDRLHLIDLLQRQGIEPSKDVATALSCQLVGISTNNFTEANSTPG